MADKGVESEFETVIRHSEEEADKLWPHFPGKLLPRESWTEFHC